MIKTLKQNFYIVLLLANVMFAANIPNSGTILNEVKPSINQKSKQIPTLPTQDSTDFITGDNSVKVLVKKFQIEKNSVFSTEVLHDLIKEYEGKELTIVEIKHVANIISKYYRNAGYFVARAYIPAQNLNDNIVRIILLEGQYGAFHIQNSSDIKDSTIEKYLSKFDRNRVIFINDLEEQIFLINSLSGLQIVDAKIAPGEKTGSSDFTLTIEPTKKFDGVLLIDNHGNKYIGDERISAVGTLNSAFGYGDSMTVYVLNSFSNELKYGNISYVFPISASGLRGNIGTSRLKYTLGDNYKTLDAYGTASVIEIGITYPIIKTSSNTLDIKGEYTYQKMTDWMNNNDSKKRIDDFVVSLESFNRTNLFEMPTTLSGYLSFTQGHKSLKTQTAKTDDEIAQTAGSFSKANLDLTHILKFNETITTKTIFNAQTSFNRNLDSSQDLSAGGNLGVRAYGNNELSGDKGYLFSFEVLRNLPTYNQLSQQAGIFYDTATIWTNTNNWDGADDNTRRLQGVGISYEASYQNINFKASFARGFGNEATSDYQSSRNKFLAQLFMVF